MSCCGNQSNPYSSKYNSSKYKKKFEKESKLRCVISQMLEKLNHKIHEYLCNILTLNLKS